MTTAYASRATRARATQTLDAWMRLWRRLSPPSEVSLTALSTLAQLSRSGAMRLTVLAEREAVSQPSMTGLVSRLETAGHISRMPDPIDGRAVLLTITPSGQRLLDVRREARLAEVDRLLDLLEPAELDAVLAAAPALDRIIGHLMD